MPHMPSEICTVQTVNAYGACLKKAVRMKHPHIVQAVSEAKQEKKVIALTKPLFNLGQCVATPGALAVLKQTEENSWQFLSRHAAGDWGVVDAEDAEANNRALKDGSQLLSAYLLNDQETKIWIITEAANDQGQRTVTTLLLPDEY